MKPKIYISGPITNNKHYMKDFEICQNYLIDEGLYDPINPAHIINSMIESGSIPEEKGNEDYYFRLALKLMLEYGCNDIIMLPKFWKSRAKIECILAYNMKYTIHYFMNGKRITL